MAWDVPLLCCGFAGITIVGVLKIQGVTALQPLCLIRRRPKSPFLVSARKNFWKMSKCADGKRQHYEAAKFSGPDEKQ